MLQPQDALAEAHTLCVEDRRKIVRLVRRDGWVVARAARAIVRTSNASGHISETTVRNILQLYDHTGDVVPRFQQEWYGGPTPALNDEDYRLIDQTLTMQPDTQVFPELLDLLNSVRPRGDAIAKSTLQAAVARLGLTNKVLTKQAMEADKEDVAAFVEWCELLTNHCDVSELSPLSDELACSPARVFAFCPCAHPAVGLVLLQTSLCGWMRPARTAPPQTGREDTVPSGNQPTAKVLPPPPLPVHTYCI